jgi:hypothetical protein
LDLRTKYLDIIFYCIIQITVTFVSSDCEMCLALAFFPRTRVIQILSSPSQQLVYYIATLLLETYDLIPHELCSVSHIFLYFCFGLGNA